MPSRLWFAADEESLPERVQKFYDDDSSPIPVQAETRAESESDQASLPTKSGFVVPAPMHVPSPPEEISVTAFKEYLYCPYRYFLKRELRLKTIQDETLELEAAAFGSLMHDVLAAFGDSPVVDALRTEPIEDYLLRTLTNLANRRFGRTRSATVSVQLQMMKNRLSAFADWQARTAKDGWRIRHTEEDLKYVDFRDSHGRPIVLAGRVDRIDQHESTGEWRVLDYKTSEQADKPEKTHFKKSQGWVDLQLPLYRLLVRSIGLDRDVSLGYIHLPGDLSKVGSSIAKWSEADLKDAEETAKAVAANIYDLKIDRLAPSNERRFTEFARICHDSVVDQQIDWLDRDDTQWRS